MTSLFVVVVAFAQAGETVAAEVSGLAEVRVAGMTGVSGVPWQTVERLRPTLDLRFGDRVAVSLTPEIGFIQGRDNVTELRRVLSESAIGPVLNTLCTWPEPKPLRVGDVIQLDRAYLDLYLPKIDLRIGRQALQWGSGQLINPTDPMPQVLFTEPWRPRAGVNAVRATIPLGPHQIQGVISANDTFTFGRVAARGTVHTHGMDISLVGAYRGDDQSGIVGLDLRGAWAVGMWVEGAVHLGQGGYGEGIYEEFTVGLDWMRPIGMGNIAVAAMYYRNGSGSLDVATTDRLATSFDPELAPDCGDAPFLGSTDAPPPSPFAPVFGGKDYALLMLQGAPVPELSANVAWLQNLDDGTGVLIPGFSVRPTGFLDLGFSGQVPVRVWGDGGELKPASEEVDLPISEGGPSLSLDLSGLIPSATLTGWMRVRY